MVAASFRSAARSLVYCAALIPVAVAALALVVAGRPRMAARWWQGLRTRLLGRSPDPDGKSGTGGPGAVGLHAVASLLLGAAALVPLGFQLLFVFRSVLYGFVDHGPYDTSWGGPTRAGAWIAHFLIGIPISAAGLAALVGIAALHQRLTAALDGQPRPRWLLPVTVVVGGLATGFVVAWSRQI